MVKWEQSGIRSNVSPKFNDAAKIVARGSTPYKTINDLYTKLPAEFSGSVAITSTLNGLDACHSGAEALPGLMKDIANGMTIGDNKSYVDLFSKFQAAQQGFAKAKFGADFFDTHEYSPTEQEIEKMIAAGIDPNMVGDGTVITTPDAPISPAPVSDNGWDQFCTGALTVVCGFGSGFFGFFGDTIGGAGAMALNACGKHELAYRWIDACDLGGEIDAWASWHGVDTDSLLYTGAKVTGQLGANGLVLLIPGAAESAVAVNATMYSCQSYKQNYRGSIEDYLAQNNIHAPTPGDMYELDEAVKHITPEMYDKATINAAGHAAITFTTTMLSGGILEAGTNSTLGDKVLGNTLVHGAGNLGHQALDVWSGRTDKINKLDVALAAGLAGVATYAAKPESATAASRDTAMRGSVTNVLNDLKDSPAAKSVGEFTSKVANSVPVNAVKGIMAAASKTYVGQKILEDATGGSNAFTLPLVHSIVGEFTKMVKNKK